ncbi:30S ribosomal protein S17e [Candidatus Micrarchaeota archaeon CG_4_10_14_0_2_um_filter_60_11]|nr:MAG: hypothetical protein AUJ16_02295 [Candidatus Micrarchaeota archaeon CG1_02_60_51]PIN96576.1 MAG: 30S ribosomal protein S17e [Candidatus Micrarchaeota archaeon CG10_big_fil_rev_8_21_14_0_10_60_32]PIO02199.1 MAG: 30S ribosomal protein S17e [Candidatus Micrarchaeota archaeon CG09_land_8_20_14_0_10_60_16]PIY91650.1 MAG: 30S ribosomal protein S17e [Candidatus Micrarchaeota archaeon CG_4_10_14_0_8_um_filter_60_7]PIZ90668.1 MAG: 30S ribosomal protein S17e [Candidatus Micrarchaeota archaeon CG_
MGRQKGKHLHTAAKKLYAEFPGKFGDNFEDSKKKLNELEAVTYSKVERNKLAGAVARLVKSAKQKGE